MCGVVKGHGLAWHGTACILKVFISVVLGVGNWGFAMFFSFWLGLRVGGGREVGGVDSGE